MKDCLWCLINWMNYWSWEFRSSSLWHIKANLRILPCPFIPQFWYPPRPRGLACSLYECAVLRRPVSDASATERPHRNIRKEKGSSFDPSRLDLSCWKWCKNQIHLFPIPQLPTWSVQGKTNNSLYWTGWTCLFFYENHQVLIFWAVKSAKRPQLLTSFALLI